jgi:hypothetical protein
MDVSTVLDLLAVFGRIKGAGLGGGERAIDCWCVDDLQLEIV